MQGLMGGGLSRSASGIKDFLLQWCQSRTRGYKVRFSSFFLYTFLLLFLFKNQIISFCRFSHFGVIVVLYIS